MGKSAQPILAFVTCVLVLIVGLGLAGFLGSWPLWPAILTVVLAGITGALDGKPVERAINSFTAMLAAGLALGGIYLYCRGEESVSAVELLIPATAAIVCALVVGDVLRRVTR